MVVAFGYDSIWFGVTIVLITEMGVITPSVSVNVYVVNGVVRDVPLETIFNGVAPMLIPMILMIAMLMIFPQVATYLPGLMR